MYVSPTIILIRRNPSLFLLFGKACPRPFVPDVFPKSVFLTCTRGRALTTTLSSQVCGAVSILLKAHLPSAFPRRAQGICCTAPLQANSDRRNIWSAPHNLRKTCPHNQADTVQPDRGQAFLPIAVNYFSLFVSEHSRGWAVGMCENA
jgi:hypothetical protein